MVKTKIDILTDPLNTFIQRENASGYILFLSVILAIIWANSPWSETYCHIWDINFSISLGSHFLSKSIHHWINDGLMSVFFFVIGLELKREFISGELSSAKKATLPIVAALGGMIVPAVIYAIINYGKPGSPGWGIPMATDIAFALGLLTLAGKRIPVSIKVFLTALAVVDDLGAVVVIAFFYSSDISLISLGTGFMFLLFLFLGNFLGIRSILFYVFFGIAGLWLAFLSSGIHPTIAGVLLAFAIPARTKINESTFLKSARNLLNQFEGKTSNGSSLPSSEQHDVIEKVKKVSRDAETPLQKLETTLHPWVAFIIMPLFAFANSGIELHPAIFKMLLNPVTTGVVMGLMIGKFAGVYIVTKIMVSLKLASLPENSTWGHMVGIALLAGVGFTMSMFITELAFIKSGMAEAAKYGILIASVISGILGVVILKRQGIQTFTGN